ncbi:MAG: hypothetical protein Q7S86_03445 [bacterium]|nr:hypothetical protein [bacterium]
MRMFIAVAAALIGLLNHVEAGEPKLSLVYHPGPPRIGRGIEFVQLSKLTLGPTWFKAKPKFQTGRLSLGVPVTTNTPSVLPDEQVRVSLEPPQKKHFPNLHYVHEERRIGNDLEGWDSFGRLWKPTPRTEIVFPYCRWDYPSRSGERVLLGFMWSRRF